MARLADAIHHYQRMLDQQVDVQGVVGEQLNKLFQEYVRELERLVSAGTFPQGGAVRSLSQIQEIQSRMEQILDDLIASSRPTWQAGTIRTTETLAAGMRATYQALSRKALADLIEAQAAFARRGAQIQAAQFTRWVDTLRSTGRTWVDALGREMVDAFTLDDGQPALVRRIKNLPGFDEEGIKNRAQMIARTEMNNIASRNHEIWTQEAGFDKYVNINPLDDRTSQGCREASRQPPMTLEEWDRWVASDGQGGRTPRRPNCRSMLMAVPSDIETNADLAADIAAAQAA